jgi:hypothetical protein
VELTIGSTLYAEFQKLYFCPAFLLELDWPGDPVYAHGGRGSISWGGHTWQAARGVGDMQFPRQDEGMAQNVAELTLVGLPDDLSDYLTDDARGASVTLYVGAYTTREGVALVGDPVAFFVGVVDARGMFIAPTDTGHARGVRIKARTGPSQKSAGVGYITLESRQVEYPNDTLMRHAMGNIEALRSGTLLR